MSWQGALEDERGFTLVEVIVVIILMLIVFGIASSTWFKVAESRRVDSATNQVVADLRLAHTQAKNRLIDTSFIVPSADSSTYEVGPAGELETRTLPGDDQGTPKTKILADTTIVFKPTGEAATPDGAPPDVITVAAIDDDCLDDGDLCHTIEINPVTSRIEIDG
jgi:prepilin-type N-terminal cleavage/methylation domain-containing protein